MEPAAVTVICVVQSVSEEGVSLVWRETVLRVRFDKITHESGDLASASTVRCGDLMEVRIHCFQVQFAVVKAAIERKLGEGSDKRIYSPSVLQIENLAEIYKNSAFSQLLTVRFSAWRSISPQPGQDAWTVLTVGYVEHLLRAGTNREIVTDFAQKLGQLADEPVVTTLHRLQDHKNRGKHWVHLMAAKCISIEFWRSLGAAVKLYCSEIFAGNSQMQKRRNDDEIEALFVFFASAFNVTVVVYQTYGHPWKVKYQPVESEEITCTSLYFLRDKQNYHILYLKDVMDDFDIATMRVNVKSRELEVSEAEFRGFAEFFVIAQRFITSVIETVECRKLFTSNLVQKLQRMFEKLHNSLSNPQLSFFQDSIPSISDLSSKLFNKLILCGLICFICRHNSPDVKLLCEHPVCKVCFQQYIDTLLADDLSFLSPSGSLSAAIHCVEANCQIPITAAIFRTYADAGKLEAALRTVREREGLQKCGICGYWLSGNSFYSSCDTCTSLICDICYSERIRSNETTCFCGSEFSMELQNFIEGLTTNCAICSESRSILNDFGNRKCEFHMICLACGVGAKECPLCESQEFLPQ